MNKRPSLRFLLARSMSFAALVAFVTFIATALLYFAGWGVLRPGTSPDNGFNGPDIDGPDIVLLVTAVGLSLVASAAIGWTLAQRFIAPLQQLGDAAEAIARGNFEVRVAQHHRSLGELSDLVSNFNKMAVLLDRAKTDLAYQNSAIAHELRTPLTILKGRLMGLVDGVFAPSPELFGSLVGHVDDLIRIVDDLGTLALFTAGQLELKLERFELKVEINALLVALDAELIQARMTVEVDTQPLIMRADRHRIRQILTALIHNSCSYAPSSTLRISAREARGMVTICVADDGPGVPGHEVGRLFERFWRADDSRSRALGGSGLGLSIVKAVTEAHGGTVIASLNPDGGLTFEITIPSQIEQVRTKPLLHGFST